MARPIGVAAGTGLTLIGVRIVTIIGVAVGADITGTIIITAGTDHFLKKKYTARITQAKPAM